MKLIQPNMPAPGNPVGVGNEYPNWISEQLADIAYSNVNDYEGTDSQKLNAFLTSHAGKTVRIPRGTYRIGSTVEVPPHTEVLAEGVVLSSNTHITILKLTSGVRLTGIEIKGSGNSLSNELGVGISIKGADVLNYAQDILISNCKIHDMGFYGIYGEFVENVKITNAEIKNIGYSGVLFTSSKKVTVDKAHIKNMAPGSVSNSYGVAFSRFKDGTLEQYPRSSDCMVLDSMIEDSIWEGLDTHAGENIIFSNNTIKNCKTSIAVVEDGVGNAPLHCKVLNNTVYGNGTGYGVVVAGASGGVKSSACLVKGNMLFDCGASGNDISGAIYVRDTIGLIISDNIISNAYEIGINIYQYNSGFSVNNNTIIDVRSNNWTACSAICLRASDNEGVINSNILKLVNTALATYVMERGINLSTRTNNLVFVGVNINNTKFPVNSLDLENAIYGTIGFQGSMILTGAPSPEGQIAAPIGSIYISRSGGVNTTFYIKENGIGKSGWVAK